MRTLSRAGRRWVVAAVATLAVVTSCKRRGTKSTDGPQAVAAPRPQPRATEDGKGESKPAGAGVVFSGARVMTATGVVYPKADIWVVGDRIEAVGVSVASKSDAKVIDVSGKTVTPGLIDTHSHIGVYASPGLSAHADGNEMAGPTTAYARAEDGYWPQDPQIERARAGGVTTMQILPGSANLIGGRSVVVKTYPEARSVHDARFELAPAGLKMACGENPKRVYKDKGGPVTRMGNLAAVRAQFQKAAEYRRSWKRYRDKLERWNSRPVDSGGDGDDDNKGPPDPPDRDFALETLADVIEGKILVHNHCYRADEMSLMMELARSYGFRIRSFHHAVEAYKIADRLAEHGAAASVWADWWGFKAEAYDGIRENAAMLSAAGARAIIHSDSAIGIQRLNQEAAKAMYAGRRAGIDITDDEALRWVTANPAWALGVDGTVGTIEAGKQADLVVWSGDPFSVYSKVEQVFIEGERVYAVGKNPKPESDFELGLVPTAMPDRGEVTR